MDNKERFLSLCSTVKRDGMEDLVRWLEETTDHIAEDCLSIR